VDIVFLDLNDNDDDLADFSDDKKFERMPQDAD
jgi:hypothetical protein